MLVVLLIRRRYRTVAPRAMEAYSTPIDAQTQDWLMAAAASGDWNTAISQLLQEVQRYKAFAISVLLIHGAVRLPAVNEHYRSSDQRSSQGPATAASLTYCLVTCRLPSGGEQATRTPTEQQQLHVLYQHLHVLHLAMFLAAQAEAAPLQAGSSRNLHQTQRCGSSYSRTCPLTCEIVLWSSNRCSL